MSPLPWSGSEATTPGSQNRDMDDAEKGLYDNTQSCLSLPSPSDLDEKSAAHIETLSSPTSPIHEGITPSSSVPVLSTTTTTTTTAPPSACSEVVVAEKQKQTTPPSAVKKPKKIISRWVLVRLWLNTYRQLFALITLLNLTGIIMASLGRFPYAQNHLGALVLGNLLCAVLMRNELFLRFLYILAIYGLRSVRPH